MITASEITNIIYQETVDLITDSDTAIVEQAIAAAEEEVKSYLRGRYDTETIFNATGNDRNAMIVEQVKVVAVWHIIILCNADLIYEQWKERYDRVIAYLKLVAKGDASPELPVATDADTGEVESPIKVISNPKFSHYF